MVWILNKTIRKTGSHHQTYASNYLLFCLNIYYDIQFELLVWWCKRILQKILAKIKTIFIEIIWVFSKTF